MPLLNNVPFYLLFCFFEFRRVWRELVQEIGFDVVGEAVCFGELDLMLDVERATHKMKVRNM